MNAIRVVCRTQQQECPAFDSSASVLKNSKSGALRDWRLELRTLSLQSRAVGPVHDRSKTPAAGSGESHQRRRQTGTDELPDPSPERPSALCFKSVVRANRYHMWADYVATSVTRGGKDRPVPPRVPGRKAPILLHCGSIGDIRAVRVRG
jgi:hypothetical protein